MIEKAVSGDVSAAKMLMEYDGDFVTKYENKGGGSNVVVLDIGNDSRRKQDHADGDAGKTERIPQLHG